MNWLRLDCSIRDHPKCRKLGILLGRERAHSYVIDLWGWAARYRPDGDITEAEDLDIAIACGWDGDPKMLLQALLNCGFVDREGDLLLIHDWQEHQGKLIERANLSSQRSREWRERMRLNKPNASRTHDEHIPNATIRNDTLRNDTVRTTPPISPPGGKFIPPSIDDVLAYAKERKQPTSLAKTFMDYFTAGNWRDSQGKPVRSWKQKFITWEKNQNPERARQDNFTGSSEPNRPCQYCGKPYPCKCYEEVEHG